MATVSNAAEWIRANGLNHVKLLFKTKPVFVYPTRGDESEKPTVEQAAQFFHNSMNMMEAGYYTLIGRHNSAFGAGDLYFNFQHGSTAPAGIGSVQEGETRLIGAITEKLTAQFEARLKEMEHARELAELKKQLKEAKQEAGTMGLGQIQQVLGQVLEVGAMMKKAPAPVVAGIQPPAPVPTPEVATEAVEGTQNRFGAAITAITQVTGPDTVEAFEALAKLAQTNPEQFRQYMNLLKAQAE